jgi:hypothetical protein
MQVLYHRCCGLDIHKKLIVACLLSMSVQGVHKEIRTFGTTLADLYRLRDWLVANECQIMAMESTGVYTPPPNIANWKWGLHNDATISADAPVESFDEFSLFVLLRRCLLSSAGQAVT